MGIQLLPLVLNGDIKAIQAINNWDEIDVNAKNEDGDTALILSIVNNKPKIFDMLLEKKADVTLCDLEGFSAFQTAMFRVKTRYFTEKLLSLKLGKFESPLFELAYFGKLKILKRVPQEQLCCQDEHGFSLLHYAIKGKDLTTICYVASQGILLTHAENHMRWTPYLLAAMMGSMDTLRIISREAKKHAITSIESARDALGMNALHIACRYGHTQVARYVINQQKDLLFAKDSDGTTPLHFASAKGSLDIIHMIQNIEENEKVWLEADNDGWNALFYACWKGRLSTMQTLLAIKSELLSTKTLNSHSNILHFACRRGQIEIAKYLITLRESLLSETSKRYGWNALHWACWSGSAELVQLIIEKKESLLLTKGDNNWNALHIACDEGHIDVAQLLIKKASALLTETTSDSDSANATPLQLACTRGYLPLVKYLATIQPESLAETNMHGWTSLHFACIHGHLPLVQYLIATRNELLATKSFTSGANILHYACRYGRLEIAQYLLDIQEALLSETATETGSTALHYACSYGHYELAKFLLEKKEDLLFAKDFNEQTALDIVNQSEHMDIAQFLAEKEENFAQGITQLTSHNKNITASRSENKGTEHPPISLLFPTNKKQRLSPEFSPDRVSQDENQQADVNSHNTPNS